MNPTNDWKVELSTAAAKQLKNLPEKIKVIAGFLLEEIEKGGPIRKDWPNFGALKKGKNVPDNAYHCHLKKGRPTYVACWTIEDKKIKLVEIFYVGTHENAPY